MFYTCVIFLPHRDDPGATDELNNFILSQVLDQLSHHRVNSNLVSHDKKFGNIYLPLYFTFTLYFYAV